MFLTTRAIQPKPLLEPVIQGFRQLLLRLARGSGRTASARVFEVHEGSRSGVDTNLAGSARRDNGVRKLEALQPAHIPGKAELRVSLLESDSAPFKASLTVLSDKSMELSLDRPLTPGSLLKLECGSTTWLGETYRCERYPDQDAYRASVWIEHALYSRANSRYAAQNGKRKAARGGAS